MQQTCTARNWWIVLGLGLRGVCVVTDSNSLLSLQAPDWWAVLGLGLGRGKSFGWTGTGREVEFATTATVCRVSKLQTGG